MKLLLSPFYLVWCCSDVKFVFHWHLFKPVEPVLTLGCTRGGGGGGCHPHKVFRRFLQQHLLIAYAVFSSCSFILETYFGKVWRQSVAMVTRYDVISSMRSSHCSIKMKKYIKYYQKQQNVSFYHTVQL